MTTSSAELSKIASNALFAQRISSINSLSALCERLGADVADISRVCGLNPRIGSGGLQAGIGFGGSCLQKDTLGLVGLANDVFLPDVAEYWRQVVVMNDFQTSRFAERVCQLGSLSSVKMIAILGYAYKKDTGDARDSLTKDVILALLKNGLSVTLHDSLVPHRHILDQLREGRDDLTVWGSDIRFCSTPYEACKGVEIVVIMNDSLEYQDLDWKQMSINMLKRQVVVDGRGVVDDTKLEALGFVVEKLGKLCYN